ncbi:MAG: glutamate--tRNA ligase [Pseudomonadota bacterium]
MATPAADRPVIVRFAPSPTGKLHVGNVRAALWNWLYARKTGGKFMLRIDDTDQARSTAAYEDGIHADLTWLGLTHDLTARQSARFDLYDDIAARLREAGLLYPCYETAEDLDRKRKLQRARGLPPVYDRAALDLTAHDKAKLEAEGRKPHWRYKLSHKPVVWQDLIRGETIVDTANVSDPVLIREDGQYLYTLPSCIDDIDFAITHVIRGEDHVTNAAVQVEIMETLLKMGRGDGASLPAFAHHSLLIGADGEGLSKRLGSLSIEGLREDGLEPAAITSLLAKLGTADPVVADGDLQALANGFEFDKVGRAPARFDADDLWSLNAKLLHEMPFAAVSDRVGAGVDEALWHGVRANIKKISEASDWQQVVYGMIEPVIEDQEFTERAATCVPDGPFTVESWANFISAVKEKTGAKGKKLFMPLRLALTGRSHGPEMGPLFALIGADKARNRLRGNKG